MRCPNCGYIIKDRKPALAAEDAYADIINGFSWFKITEKYFRKMNTVKDVTYNNEIIENINNMLPDNAYKFTLYSVITINGKLPQEL